jgi:predicted ribosomally synthesized peptide with SipW-like signal peptide
VEEVKKIVGLSIAIVLIIGLVAGGTWAYFSDIETAEDNTITAGTVDIAIDGKNPFTGTFTIDDMKPCNVEYITFNIQNVGENPVVLWKHITIKSCDGGTLTEPEATAQGGVYPDPGTERCNIQTVIEYDLTVGGEVIFSADDGLTMDDIRCFWMPLGTLNSGDTLLVEQSYHMQADTGNWAQGDILTFNIEIYAEQRLGNGPAESPVQRLFLDNKTGDPDWYFVPDGEWGLLYYNASGPTFDYTLTAQGLQDGGVTTNYSLIYYPEPQTAWPHPVVVIASGNTDGAGNLSLSGSFNLNMDLTNAKIWLCVSTDLNATPAYSAWPPTDTLFEGNKISFDDTDV